MAYKITKGMAESDLKDWLEKARKKYGLYKGKGVNFTHATIAPVVMCTVLCGNEILIAKRGYGLADAEGYWSTVNGFIDEIKPVAVIVQQELKEELGLDVGVSLIKVGSSYTVKNSQLKRRYIVFPCLVELSSKPKIVLDHEHVDCAWIRREQLESYEILDDLPHVIDTALNLVSSKSKQ